MWELGITHEAREHALSDKELSIMAAMVTCRDLLRRVADETTYPDDCASNIEEIEAAMIAIDAAIAGFVERHIGEWTTIDSLLKEND